jgi:sarcosine oxidase
MFDVAVIGLGIMGSAATYECARRGRRVVALDRFRPGHDRGSSHGESRAIRLAHFEGSSYYALAVRAYKRWRELERLSGREILAQPGVLECGPKNSAIVAESARAAREHGLAHELLGAAAVIARFPAFRLPGDWHAVFQPDGGLLRAEAALSTYVEAARSAGADIRAPCRVLSIQPGSDSVRVATEQGTVEAGAVIIAAGAWVTDFVPALAPFLTLTRQVLVWLAPPTETALFRVERFPVFLVDDPDDLCYGFPALSSAGVKVASHNPSGELTHADDAGQDATLAEGERVARVVARYIPALAAPVVRLKTCMYTRAPDEHFVIDTHPDDSRIVIASPCSGHGFKFASAIGEILADLALTGVTAHDISRFRMSRFG